MSTPINHCAICGREIEPERAFCEVCERQAKELDPCPVCGRIICECEAGSGD